MPATQETSNVVSIRVVNFSKTICVGHPAREHKVPSLTTDDVDCQSAHAFARLFSVGLSTAGMGDRGLTTAHLRGIRTPSYKVAVLFGTLIPKSLTESLYAFRHNASTSHTQTNTQAHSLQR